MNKAKNKYNKQKLALFFVLKKGNKKKNAKFNLPVQVKNPLHIKILDQ